MMEKSNCFTGRKSDSHHVPDLFATEQIVRLALFILPYRTRSLIRTLNSFFAYGSHRQEAAGREPWHTGWLQQPLSLYHL